MPISFNNRLTFIHIPKCGGTTITKMIRSGSAANLYSQKPLGQLVRSGRLKISETHNLSDEQYESALQKTPQHLTAYEIKQLFPWAPAKTFTMVRNPYDRLVSEYSFVLQDITYVKDPRYINVRRGFDSFVRWGLSLPQPQRIAVFDGHLEPQITFIKDPQGATIVDNIFRFEAIEECFQFVRDNYVEAPTPTVEKKSSHPHYTTFYSQSLKDLVTTFYKDDLHTFNYCFQ